MGDLLGSPRVAPLLFAALVETASPPILSFFSSSPTLCARAVTSSFPSLRCHRWGPPLVACRRGPAPPSRLLGNCFLKIIAKITSPRLQNRGAAEEKVKLFPQRRKRAKC